MKTKRFCPYCAAPLIDRWYEGRDRRFCETCREPVYENPIPAACLLVIDPEERLLLVKRSVDPKKGFWCLPGGFMELGETPEATALRELKEETGLDARIHRLFDANANPSALYDTVALFCYLVREFNGTPRAGDDADAVAFFPPSALPEIAFSSHLKFIGKYYNFS